MCTHLYGLCTYIYTHMQVLKLYIMVYYKLGMVFPSLTQLQGLRVLDVLAASGLSDVQISHEMSMSLGDNPMSYRTPWYSNSNPIPSPMELYHHMGRYNPNVLPILCPMGVLWTSMGLYHQRGTLQS